LRRLDTANVTLTYTCILNFAEPVEIKSGWEKAIRSGLVVLTICPTISGYISR
jgi:hypothetical protein